MISRLQGVICIMLKSVNLLLPQDLCIDDFKKSISFISKDIVSYLIEDNMLKLELTDDADTDFIQDRVQSMMKKFVSLQQTNSPLFEQIDNRDYLGRSEIFKHQQIQVIAPGSICLHNKAAKLYDFFDETFSQMALQIGAAIEHYPVLLPVEAYRKTGYLRTSPQYSMFCCNAIEDMFLLEKINKSENLSEFLSEPNLALSPAACFHTYCSHENHTLQKETVYTFNQNVFRNEGRLNWDDFGRLRDYHVREIVFLGSDAFVRTKKDKILELVIAFLQEIELNAKIFIAHDPFVIPKMQKFKKVQIQEGNKYELQIYYASEKSLAAASFNVHGTAFTQPFNIKVEKVDAAVTGCIGFGLERWVLAFIAQYGWDEYKWPEIIQNFMKG